MLMLCLLLSACGTKIVSTATSEPLSTIEISDGGLLAEQASCKPPCLLGITPGITRESEAWKILEAQELSRACQVWDNTKEAGTRGIQCEWNREFIGIGLESQDDTIRFIGFTPSETIRISQVVGKYGEPSWVAIWDEGTPEHVEIGFTVFYDAITTRLDFLSQDGWVYDLQPETTITSVSYLSAQEYTDYIDLIKASLYPWQGYGEYPRK